jgi:hypothetical protein
MARGRQARRNGFIQSITYADYAEFADFAENSLEKLLTDPFHPRNSALP